METMLVILLVLAVAGDVMLAAALVRLYRRREREDDREDLLRAVQDTVEQERAEAEERARQEADAQAQAEERDVMGAGVPDGSDHAFDPPAAESAGDKDAADI